jgi:hypothetical protein
MGSEDFLRSKNMKNLLSIFWHKKELAIVRIAVALIVLLTIAATTIPPEVFVKEYSSVADLVAKGGPRGLYRTAYVHGYYTPGDGGEGMFIVTNTVTSTNYGTRIYSGVSGYSWERVRPIGIVEAQWFGLKPDGSTDNATRASSMLNTSGARRGHFGNEGTYVIGSQVNIANDLILSLGRGAIIKRGNNATGATLAFTVPQTGGIEGSGVFDGNKANNSATANRGPFIAYYGAGASIQDITFTNYVIGISDILSTVGWKLENVKFRNGAEHGGTLGDISSAVTIVLNIAGARPHFDFIRNRAIQDADPSAYGKAPGFIYIAGNLASDCLISGTAVGNFSDRMGQDFAGNHIGGVLDLYEATINWKVEANEAIRCRYIPYKLNNTRNLICIGNSATGYDSASPGTAGDSHFNFGTMRSALSGEYGRMIVANNYSEDAAQFDSFRFTGQTLTTQNGGEMQFIGNYASNATGRAFYMANWWGENILVGNSLFGQFANASSGASRVDNLQGTIRSRGNTYKAGTGTHPFYMTSGVSAGDAYFENDAFIKTGDTGFYPAVFGGLNYLSLDGCDFDNKDSSGGNTLRITSGTTVELRGNSMITGSAGPLITWASVTTFKGEIEASGSPISLVPGGYGLRYLDTATGIRYTKKSASGTDGWRRDITEDLNRTVRIFYNGTTLVSENTAAAATGTASLQTPTSTSPALINLVTTAATTGTDLGIQETAAYHYFGRAIRAHAWIKLEETTNVRYWVGITGGAGSTMAGVDDASTDIAAFRYSTSAGDTNWKCVTNDGGSPSTITDSGVAASTSFTIFSIEHTPGVNVKFYINGTLVATHTTDLPRSTSAGRLKAFGETLENVNKNLRVGILYSEEARP